VSSAPRSVVKATCRRPEHQLVIDAETDHKYPAYSIRHAQITALFDVGPNESQVNVYMGHSQIAHMIATSYFLLNSK
jgi:site-specific recombinase XerD